MDKCLLSSGNNDWETPQDFFHMLNRSDKSLLPCPFCGGDAIINTVAPHKHMQTWMPDYNGGTFVECSKCTCMISAKNTTEAKIIWNGRIKNENCNNGR